MVSYRTVGPPIPGTTTPTGLSGRAALDTSRYETGFAVNDQDLARVNLTPNSFHGEWYDTLYASPQLASFIISLSLGAPQRVNHRVGINSYAGVTHHSRHRLIPAPGHTHVRCFLDYRPSRWPGCPPIGQADKGKV